MSPAQGLTVTNTTPRGAESMFSERHAVRGRVHANSWGGWFQEPWVERHLWVRGDQIEMNGGGELETIVAAVCWGDVPWFSSGGHSKNM